MIKRDLLDPTDRALTERERFLLSHALIRDHAPTEFREQVVHVRVSAQSQSAWPILGFAVDQRACSAGPGALVVAQLQYIEAGIQFVLSVYEEFGYLAGMLCWSMDGEAEPHSWPNPHELHPLELPDA